MTAQLHRTLWEIQIKIILSGTSSSIRTKLWWNSHWMVLFQNCVRQSRSPTKMATTVQLRYYWKQLWSRWAITGSWEPLVIILQTSNHIIYHKYQAILFITSFSIGNQKQSHNAIITFILEFSNFLKKSQQGLTSQMKVICIMHITIRLF